METPEKHSLAPEHLPGYVTAADGSDYLFTVMVFFGVGLILLIGILYLTLHSMPEKMAHESNHSQMQVVGILALLALFTHNNGFWVIAILVAAFRLPDFMTPVNSIAQSLSVLAKGNTGSQDPADVSLSPDDGDHPDLSETKTEGAH